MHRDDDSVRASFLIGQKESGSYLEVLVISANGPCFLYVPFMSLKFEVLHLFSSLSFVYPSIVCDYCLACWGYRLNCSFAETKCNAFTQLRILGLTFRMD